ncbi:beta-propeller fold lactonase family protein, partial [Paraglaciecola sp. 25GB23A]|uniref:beta-propeller fold lactonase family protein n=1 Tax=Paraglaciecola sp. 25GB23A TaxID=3156068 RepID=UPI0032AEC531
MFCSLFFIQSYHLHATEYEKISSLSEGVFESPSEFVIGPNQQYMYVASQNGIVVVELDDSAEPTSNTTIFDEFGENESIAGFGEGLVLSPSGKFLYWSGQINKSGQFFMGLVAFSVDETTGLLTHVQTLGFDSSSGIDTGSSSETLVISPDGKHIYSHNPYGEMGQGLILIYELNTVNGEMKFADIYDMGDVWVNYEHNFDLTYDGQFLVYAYSDYSGQGAQIVVLKRNPIPGYLSEVSRTQWSQVSSLSDLTLKSSSLDEHFYIYSEGSLAVFTIDDEGALAWHYNVTTPSYESAGAMSLDINSTGDQIVVLANKLDYLQILDNFSLNSLTNKFEFKDRVESLDGFSFRTRFNPDGNKIVWFGWNSDRFYSLDSISFEPSGIIEYPFGDIGLENLNPLYVSENNLIGFATANLTSPYAINLLSNGNDISIATQSFSDRAPSSRDSYLTINERLLVRVARLQADPNMTAVEFIERNILEDTFSTIKTVSLGDSGNRYVIYSAAIDPTGEYLVALERSQNTNNQYGIALYKIDATNLNLNFISSLNWGEIEPTSTFPSSWYSGVIKPVFFKQTNAFALGNKLFRYGSDSFNYIGYLSSPSDLDLFVAEDGNAAFSLEKDASTGTTNISSFSVDYSATEASAFLTSTGALTNLDGLLTIVSATSYKLTFITDTQMGQLAFVETAYNSSLSLAAPIRAINTIPVDIRNPDGVSVKVYPSEDNPNVYWLALQGGSYDVIKISELEPQTQLFLFSYTFDASVRGTQNHNLLGIVAGVLQDDGDTVVIEDLVYARLADIDYSITDAIGIRAADPTNKPVISLSGNNVDLWVCVKGFTYIDGVGGGDCLFGAEGGFLIAPYLSTSTGECLSESTESICDLWAWAGIPQLGDDYRDGDIPFNQNNWFGGYVGEAIDTDIDGIFDLLDWDDDNDGIEDESDAYPLISIGELLDTDNDGAPDECDNDCLFLGMNADLDDDNDGVLDVDDAYPLDPSRSSEVNYVAKNDVDGDGKSDLLWRSEARGWNFLWAMNGTQTKEARPINVVQDDGWLMAGQGDYDADGKSDIFWRNTITGQNFI